jgi:very-short-patch-repair endonuclease
MLDIEKEKLLNQKWFKVIRIRNEEIQNNIQNIIEKIVASLP